MNQSLQSIAEKHETDKSGHGYCPHYELRFDEYRRKPIAILEIGVAGGNSLRMWREYFPYSKIVGIDNDASCKAVGDVINVTVEIGDQTNGEFLTTVADRHGPFDIVIDDGSHIASDQLVSFGSLWPHVSGSGWYVVEDLHVWFDSPTINPPGARTLLDMLIGRRLDILTGTKSDAKEFHVVGGPNNDGLLFIRKTGANACILLP